jgi:hypothetical protein
LEREFHFKLGKKLYFSMGYFDLFTRIIILCALLYFTFSSLKDVGHYATTENVKAASTLYHDFLHYISFFPAMFTSIFLYFFFGFLVSLWFVRLIFVLAFRSIVRVDPENEFEYHPQIKYLL